MYKCLINQGVYTSIVKHGVPQRSSLRPLMFVSNTVLQNFPKMTNSELHLYTVHANLKVSASSKNELELTSESQLISIIFIKYFNNKLF